MCPGAWQKQTKIFSGKCTCILHLELFFLIIIKISLSAYSQSQPGTYRNIYHVDEPTEKQQKQTHRNLDWSATGYKISIVTMLRKIKDNHEYGLHGTWNHKKWCSRCEKEPNILQDTEQLNVKIRRSLVGKTAD